MDRLPHQVINSIDGTSTIFELHGVFNDFFKNKIVMQLRKLYLLEYKRRVLHYVLASDRIDLLISYDTPTFKNRTKDEMVSEVIQNWGDYLKTYHSKAYPNLFFMDEENSKFFEFYSHHENFYEKDNAGSSYYSVQKTILDLYPEAKTIELYNGYNSRPLGNCTLCNQK